MAERMPRRWISHGEAGTCALAAFLLSDPRRGDVVALVGDLGAGKTRFVEGACRALGYAGRVRSPSYTLLNVYQARRLPVYHFDLYRWEASRQEIEWEEWEERIDGEGISFIEWADRLGAALPARSLIVTIEPRSAESRAITVAAAEPHHRARLAQLADPAVRATLEGVEPDR